MIKNGGNLCDFAAATLVETLRQAQKHEVELRDHDLTYARSATPQNCSKSTRPLSLVGGWGLGSRLPSTHTALCLQQVAGLSRVA